MGDISVYTQILFTGLTLGGAYGILAIALNVVLNTTTFFNFTQAEFAVFGALLAYTIVSVLNLPLAVAFLVALVVVSGLGMLIHAVFINPIKSSPHIIVVILTFGLMVALEGIWVWGWGPNLLAIPSFVGTGAIHILGGAIAHQTFLVWGAVLLLGIAAYLFFRNTILGKAMRACSENRDVASLMGINVGRMELFSWGIAGAMGAVTGMVLFPLLGVMFNSGEHLVMMALVALIIGGMGNIMGGLAGGVTLGLVEAMGAGFASEFKDVFAFGLLIVVLVIRPRGIFGGR